jgi:hypothetical protein
MTEIEYDKKNTHFRCGCFFNTIKEFEKSVSKKHGNNLYGQEYIATIKMIEAVFKARAESDKESKK